MYIYLSVYTNGVLLRLPTTERFYANWQIIHNTQTHTVIANPKLPKDFNISVPMVSTIIYKIDKEYMKN